MYIVIRIQAAYEPGSYIYETSLHYFLPTRFLVSFFTNYMFANVPVQVLFCSQVAGSTP